MKLLGAGFLLPLNLEKVCTEDQRKYSEPLAESILRHIDNKEILRNPKNGKIYIIFKDDLRNVISGHIPVKKNMIDEHPYMSLDSAIPEAKPWEYIIEINLQPQCSKRLVSNLYFGSGARLMENQWITRDF